MRDKISILWAEDKEITFNSYSRKLSKYFKDKGSELNMDRANDGNAVYRFLLSKKYSLILMDLEMPNWGGLDAIPEISKKYNTPILVVTALISEYEETLNIYKQKGLILGYIDLTRHFDHAAKTIFEVCSPKSISFIHLSDIHFGKYHAFSKELKIKDALLPKLEEIKRNGNTDFLLITGDLTSEAKEEEFNEAKDFLIWVGQELNIELSKILIVPGNHDIYRKEEPRYRFRKYIDFLNSLYKEAIIPNNILKRYSNLYDSTTNTLSLVNKNEDDCFFIASFNDIQFTIIGLNSVISDEKRWAFSEIAPKQLRKVSDVLKDSSIHPTNNFRLALFHHNLFVVPDIFNDGDPDRIIRNQGLVIKTLLSKKVKMVLHGHTHFSTGYKFQPYYSDIWEEGYSDSIHIFSTGTLSGKEQQSSQSYFHLTQIHISENEDKEFSRGRVIPHKLFSNSLDWKIGNVVNIDFKN